MSLRGWRKPNTYEDRNDSCANQRRNIFSHMGMLNIIFVLSWQDLNELCGFKTNFFLFPINKFNNYGRVTSKIEKDCNKSIIIESPFILFHPRVKRLLAYFKSGDYVSFNWSKLSDRPRNSLAGCHQEMMLGIRSQDTKSSELSIVLQRMSSLEHRREAQERSDKS